MATITYRALDTNGDPQWGSGQASYLTDLDAVAQIIQTKLLLFQGEWWESLSIGTPWFQSILGANRSIQTIATILRQQILSVPYVTGISNVEFASNPSTRKFTYSCNVQTQFGTLVVTNQQGSNATIAS